MINQINFKLIWSIFLLSTLTHLDVRAMKATTKGARNLASKALLKTLKPETIASSSWQPTVVDFPSYESSSSSQKTSGPKKRWYQSKYFKYPMYATGAGAVGVTSLINRGPGFIENVLIKFSDDAQTADPDLYKVFLEIAKQYEIPEGEVSLRILHSPTEERYGSPSNTKEALMFDVANEAYDRSPAFTESHFHNIFINDRVLLFFSKPLMIAVLAHELEHYRQFNKYIGSYQPAYFTKNTPTAAQLLANGIFPEKFNAEKLKLETGADAAAAGFLSCPDCIEAPKSHSESFISYDPTIVAGSHFNSKTGYFSPQDYNEYIENAKRDCIQCRAHTEGTHNDPSTPLSHFLPPTAK